MSKAALTWFGVAIILVGFLVVALGASLGSGGSSSSEGFILIGPVPIVFGSGPNTGQLTLVGLVVTVAVVVFYVISFFFWRSGRRREAEVGAESE
jgi:uncharacterized membrane protein